MSARGRHGARRLLVQALYQSQIGGHDVEELISQFSESSEFDGVDAEYFVSILHEIMSARDVLDQHIALLADRPVGQLDPIERCVLWLGVTELKSHEDIPSKVIINEAVKLAKEFGGQGSFRYVNAILDKTSTEFR